MNSHTSDIDAQETQEWIEAIEDIIRRDGNDRAQYILSRISQYMGSPLNSSDSVNTPYENSIKESQEKKYNGDLEMERRIENICRWNTMAMVTKANKDSDGIGGHIASYASASTLYEVGYNYFFNGPKGDFLGDQVFFQGHVVPGIYSRAYLEGRLSERDLRAFRRELMKGGGLPSYPHPRLTDKFWQFPTVSMGLGSILALYVARFNRYLHDRGIRDTSKSNVWAFLGDGELSEPEVYGSIFWATREKLDNLIFVVNCNLQRLDGPVYGNGSIIQETEGMFKGAKWNVIKVIWSSEWDSIWKDPSSQALVEFMGNTPDGDIQRLALMTRDEVLNYFKEDEEAYNVIKDYDEETLKRLFVWGGHDIKKIYAAYHQATKEKNGKPTVILAKTIKGYGMGSSGFARNTAHQQKKVDEKNLIAFVKESGLPISDKDARECKLYHPGKDSEELKYIESRRKEMGGLLPYRNEFGEGQLRIPKIPSETYGKFFKGAGERTLSTTKSFVQILSALLRVKELNKHLVPILCDEARTFGMEGLFGQYGIYNSQGQKYTPVDGKSLMPYKEKINGQILQEGINEAGSLSSFIAAGTSYSYQGVEMIPFYSFYSMFGFQRVGDAIWQATDMKCKGFLMGGTAGRTTLNGEGLQHEDGHSVVLASVYPTIHVYDPAFEYEMATVIKHGIEKMYHKGIDCLYYVMMYNEDYKHPPMPKSVKEEDIIKGLYLYEGSKSADINLMSSGVVFKDALLAKEILEKKYKLKVNIYSATSFKYLRDEAMKIERNRMMDPKNKEISHVEKTFKNLKVPLLSVTDYVRAWSELIRPWIPSTYVSLGTDGFGHSSSREELREHFEINVEHIVYGALYALFLEKKWSEDDLKNAQKDLKIDFKKSSGLDDISL